MNKITKNQLIYSAIIQTLKDEFNYTEQDILILIKELKKEKLKERLKEII